MKLYTAGRNGISLGGRTYLHFIAESGVKQGCPSSMILFTIAFDPIIRWIDSLLSPIGSSLFCYCDDLSVACRNMIKAWGILLKLFRIVTLMSSL